jgi:integrase
MAATEPIRNKKQVKELANFYLQRGQLRNHLLIIMGVHTALRISDLLRLKWEDLYDFGNTRVRGSFTISEKKTRKSKTIVLNKSAIRALTLFASRKSVQPGGFVFENRKTGNAISRIQAYRLIRAATESLAWQHHVSCHSLRKTFGYHAWKSGVSPAVIMEIYNHSSFSVTRRYLGITQDDKNEVYLALSFLG